MPYKEKFCLLMYRLKEVGYTRVSFSCFDTDIPASTTMGVYASQSIRYIKSYAYVYPEIKTYGTVCPLWDIVTDLGIGATGGSMNSHGLIVPFMVHVGSSSYRLVEGEWQKLPRKYDSPVLYDILNNIQVNNLYSTIRYHATHLDRLSDDYDVEAVAEVIRVLDVLKCPYDDLPLYINHTIKKPIATWRLLNHGYD
jgi:hypothetical protein